MTRSRLTVGKTKGRFCRKIESKRREKVSESAVLKWNRQRVENDHGGYCTTSTCTASSSSTEQDHGHCQPDISDVQNDVIVETDSIDWSRGRRIVELGILAEALRSCKNCSNPLQLSHAISSRNYGLAAIIKIPCSNIKCKYINHVPTGKRHGEQSRTWDVNSKLANALTHAGIGVTQLNSFLTALNIPPVHHKLADKRKTEMGLAVESVAHDSILESIEEETALTQQLNESGLSVSVDAGWQKRGSGKSYDSLSGHATMVGSKTGKVVGYSVRSKACRICDSAAKNKTDPPSHDCRRNWHGSAKAMEQDMVVDMVRKCHATGSKISTIIGDEDTSTISKLHKDVDQTIKKRSDKNHMKKTFTNKLFALQRKHPKFVSTNTIKYIKKCWSYMLSQNKKNPQGISIGLKAISRHPFGDHSLCGDWCEHLKNPTRKYSCLPYGKCLKDKELQKSLDELLESYQPHCEKLADLGSTQSNESLNNTIASKAPKRLHLSGSSSLNIRVAAGIAQKNIGHNYVSKVNLKAGLSPGEYTMKLAKLRDEQHRKRKAIAQTKEKKRRRLELKARRVQSNSSKETREGPTYSSGMGLSLQSDAVDTEIPPPKPVPTDMPLEVSKEHSMVFFDLETTGLARSSHITQIAAICGKKEFNTFILPKQRISTEATKVTGITIENGKMYHEGKEVETTPVSCALKDFITFLRSLGNKIILVGHNIINFDCPVLINALSSCDLIDEFTGVLDGFVDSLKLFRHAYPDLDSYKQENLCKMHNIFYREHDARCDVDALQRLFSQVPCQLCSLHTRFCSADCDSLLRRWYYSKEIDKNLPSLQSLIDSKALSKCMARKVAGSGLKYCHLELAFRRDPDNGISNLFIEQTGTGANRVTKSKKVVTQVVEYFAKLREC